jgi:hypothetical protein
MRGGLALKVLLLLAAALALPVFGQPAQDQSLEAKLSAVVGDYSLAGFGSPRTIAKLGSDFHLPMGIETISRELHTPPQPSVMKLRGPWHGVTVAAILRDVVEQMPGHEFEISNGVVHVFPSSLRGDAADILNAHLPVFEVRNELVAVAAKQLAVQASDLMTPPRGVHPSFDILSSSRDRPVSFRLENPTIREALDKLCLSDRLNIWMVSYPAQLEKTRGGYYKTYPANVYPRPEGPDAPFLPSWSLMGWDDWPQSVPAGNGR